MKLGLVILALALPGKLWACASCGCTLSSDWENSTTTGFKLDLRYDFVDQTQLRSGTSTIGASDAAKLTNNGNPQEIEKYTTNNYVTLTGDYTFNSDWKLEAQVPYISRKHSTLGTASDGATAGPGGGQYDSNTSNLGDVKVLGRYQGFNDQHNWGVIAGVKLPTGSHTLEGTSTDATAPGPVKIDRGLQPGSGTTDIIAGIYFSDAFNKDWDYYTQDLFQLALNSSDQYRPGNGLNLNFGLRYMAWTALMPQVQLNARYVQKDGGAQADTISTGGTLLYVSPGAVVPLGAQAAVYGFFQLPVYQNLQGVQLAPTYTASLGMRYEF
jgi:hypothetical protein